MESLTSEREAVTDRETKNLKDIYEKKTGGI